MSGNLRQHCYSFRCGLNYMIVNKLVSLACAFLVAVHPYESMDANIDAKIFPPPNALPVAT